MIELFGHTEQGDAVHAVTLSNGQLTARLLSYGGILQDLRLAGHGPSLVLGFDSFAPYLNESGYIGATAGRYANRIAEGQFTLDGQTYHLDRNFRERHTLHGGTISTGKQLWSVAEHGDEAVTFMLTVPDGHMGFPGCLQIALEWRLSGQTTLGLTLRARTDAPTVCNLAHHSYFNLSGQTDSSGHRLMVAADRYLPVDNDLIPTGQLCPVAETPFDFRKPAELPASTPVDHNFCLSSGRQPIRPVAWLSAKGGPDLELRTTEPGLQVYDGAKLSTQETGINGFAYSANAGIALEPQLWPDAPHHAHFPSAVLRPGELYIQETEFKFSL